MKKMPPNQLIYDRMHHAKNITAAVLHKSQKSNTFYFLVEEFFYVDADAATLDDEINILRAFFLRKIPARRKAIIISLDFNHIFPERVEANFRWGYPTK